MVDRRGVEDEQRMVGRRREAQLHPPVAHAAGNAEDGRAKAAGNAAGGAPRPVPPSLHPCPPVAPWSLISPPMKAMALPSGDHRGTAICKPCSGPETSAGARMALGEPEPPSAWV